MEKKELVEGWYVSVIYSIYKKDDPQICDNNRGLALLNVTYKVLPYCILDRIKPIAEASRGDY